MWTTSVDVPVDVTVEVAVEVTIEFVADVDKTGNVESDRDLTGPAFEQPEGRICACIVELVIRTSPCTHRVLDARWCVPSR